MARLDQLAKAKELVHVCATIGAEFSLELLRATASSVEESSAHAGQAGRAELFNTAASRVSTRSGTRCSRSRPTRPC